MTHQDIARQPVLFIPHGGGPCFFMEWQPADTWVGMGAFLKSVAGRLPQRPSAIVMVSAHWMGPEFRVTSHARPGLIYDYYGFPAHTYELTYPSPGEPQLAERVAQLIRAEGLDAEVDAERGFDHGMFIPMKMMFPAADIPVIQLSLRKDLDPVAHMQMGRALMKLRDENVLIIGSGMSFHNMRAYGDTRFSAVSDAFDEWLTNAVESEAAERAQQLRAWGEAPHAQLCHPQGGEEHLIPLMVAAGAAGDSQGRKIYSERVMQTTISAFQFG